MPDGTLTMHAKKLYNANINQFKNPYISNECPQDCVWYTFIYRPKPDIHMNIAAMLCIKLTRRQQT